MAVAAATRLGPYLLRERLGEGGMGSVWRAEDPRLGREIAVKLLPERLRDERDRIDRLEQEARAVAALQHANIVTLYTVEEAEGRRFLTMELVRGRTLDRMIPEEGLPLPEFFRLAVPLVDAIAAAHRRGIVHRDLKPRNVMVDEAGTVKVLDFGLAVSFDRSCDERPRENDDGEDGDSVTDTIPGAHGITGTLPYMSPEQVRGETAGAASDIFNLGILLYEMLTARRPFSGRTAAERIASILRDDPAPPADTRPDIPRHLDRVVRRCLEKDPARRIESASRLVAELRAIERETRSPAARDARAIAVLPFRDRGETKAHAHLCEGIAEDLIHSLTRVETLRVAARSASFRFPSGTCDVREVADRLGVTSVLEGSVRSNGTGLRVTADLVDASDGSQIWSRSYDGALDDVFAFEERIAREVVEALHVGLSPRERRAMRQVATENVHAYEYYVRGRSFYAQCRRRAMEMALQMFRRAIDLDPGYALAHTGVADCCSFLYRQTDRDERLLHEADRASRRAVALDPDLAEAHTSRGIVLTVSGRAEEARGAFEQALRLNPRSFETHYEYARSCFDFGRPEDAVREYERAFALRPEDYQSPLLVAQIYDALGRREEGDDARRRGVEAARRRLELHPDDGRAMYMLANGLVGLERTVEGLAWAVRAERTEPDEPMLLYNLACIHALAGAPDAAIERLQRAVDHGFRHRTWLERDGNLDSLRGRDDFEALLARLG